MWQEGGNARSTTLSAKDSVESQTYQSPEFSAREGVLDTLLAAAADAKDGGAISRLGQAAGHWLEN